MSARSPWKFVLLFTATVVVGCTSPSSSASGARWPWTKAKPAHSDDGKLRNPDLLGAPPTPKLAKAGVNKPNLSTPHESPSSITLRTPRIISDRELERANR
jgi:hypothetical protein